MLLTKIWGSLLAFLATTFLAGMFLLSINTGGFSDADKAAIRAITEAGLAALRAEVSSSATQRAHALLSDPRLKEALAVPVPVAEDEADGSDLDRILAEVAEEHQLGSRGITVGLADDEGQVLASHGNGKAEGVRKLVQDAVDSEAFRALNSTDESLFSATLDGRVHVVKVSPAVQTGHRLIAIQELATGAGSSLRRVLGTQTPAGLVLDGRLTGEIIGDLEIGGVIETLAQVHGPSTPEQGASEAFFVGEGLNARIGALGRVPGPAGQGANAVMLVVLSRNTAAAEKKDLAQALDNAVAEGQLERLQWPVLIAILVLGVALALYLPQFEAVSPLRRLGQELLAVAEGSRHQVFQERYTGPIGDVARAANAAQEAIHAAYLLEQSREDPMEDAPPGEGQASGSRPQMRTARARRPTRRLRRATGVRAAVSSTDGDVEDSSEISAREDPGASSSGAAIAPADVRSARSGRHSAAATPAKTSRSTGPTEDAANSGLNPRDHHAPAASASLRSPVTPPPPPASATGSGVRPSTSSSALSAGSSGPRTSLGSAGGAATASSSFPQPASSGAFPASASRSASWSQARSEASGSRPHESGTARAAARSGSRSASDFRTGSGRTEGASPSVPPPLPGSRASASLASLSRSALGGGPPPIPGSGRVAPTSPRPVAPAVAPPSASQALDGAALQDREIYEEFVQVKMACGEPVEGFTFEKFAAKLTKNREQLLGRPGVKDVTFTVYVKDGKAALKAKIVKD